MSNNYNSVAFFYDALNRVVFGKSTVKSQVWLLEKIPAHAHVLIIGGGTGWILEKLSGIHTEGLYITYIESAQNMLNRSKRRDIKNNKINFVHQDAQNYIPETSFNVIITPFLFDNFSTEQVKHMIAHYFDHIDPGGLWLVTDYQITNKGKRWQKPLLDTMYTFFRLLSHVPVKKMPDIEGSFQEFKFEKQESKTFYGGFILSTIYQKRVK